VSKTGDFCLRPATQVSDKSLIYNVKIDYQGSALPLSYGSLRMTLGHTRAASGLARRLDGFPPSPQLSLMSVKDKEMPGQGAAGPAAPAAMKPSPKAARKEARLAEALRANLAKRKNQAQARAAGEKPTDRSAANPPQSAPQNPGKPPRPA